MDSTEIVKSTIKGTLFNAFSTTIFIFHECNRMFPCFPRGWLLSEKYQNLLLHECNKNFIYRKTKHHLLIYYICNRLLSWQFLPKQVISREKNHDQCYACSGVKTEKSFLCGKFNISDCYIRILPKTQNSIMDLIIYSINLILKFQKTMTNSRHLWWNLYISL